MLDHATVDLPVMPMVNNYDGKDWLMPAGNAEMLANPAARKQLAKSLTDIADAQHDPGIVVDFESGSRFQPAGF